MTSNAKHIVITGAGSGLGASLARKYHSQGHHVTLIGRRSEKLELIANSLGDENYSLYPLDVSAFDEVVKTFEQIVSEVKPIDILINNAGLGFFDLAENLPEDHINQMIDINLKGTIFCTQQVIGDMKERNEGSIINIVSTAGVEGKVTESVYCASKFGIRGFTESIVKELEDTNVHVNAIYMGGMKTPFWDGLMDKEDTGGLMDPDDIADIILANTKIRNNINVKDVIIKNH